MAKLRLVATKNAKAKKQPNFTLDVSPYVSALPAKPTPADGVVATWRDIERDRLDAFRFF